MNEQIIKIRKNTTEFWNRLSKRNKGLIIAGIIAVIVIALIIAILLNNKDYVVLFSNIDKEEAAEVMKQLQDNDVDYKYENDGTILIPQSQENILRMELAESGYPRTGSNYDLFTESIDFMTTDFEKNTYKVYQLQERLQNSIKTIDGVKDAIVTINLPDEKSFAWETDKAEASASVKINLVNGKTLTPSQTKGILQLVSKSVQGLKEENVAILDTEGNSLTVSEDVLQTNLIQLKLKIEKEFEEDTEKSVKEFLSAVYGPENIQVSSKCTINFDVKISELLKYLPDEETKLGTPGNTQTEREITGPGEVTGGIPGTETNAEVPTYPGVTIEGDDIYFKDTNAINYLVSQLKEQIQHNPGEIEDLTVAVVINKSVMSDEELDDVRNLVAFSSGVDISKVALSNMEFYKPDSLPIIATDPLEVIPNITREVLIYGGIGVAVLAVLIFIASIIMSRRKKKGDKSAGSSEEKVPDKYSWEDIQEEIVVHETKEQAIKKQVKEFTVNNPEIAAQLIRTWLKGEDE